MSSLDHKIQCAGDAWGVSFSINTTMVLHVSFSSVTQLIAQASMHGWCSSWRSEQPSSPHFLRSMIRTWYADQTNNQALLHCFPKKSTKRLRKKPKIRMQMLQPSTIEEERSWGYSCYVSSCCICDPPPHLCWLFLAPTKWFSPLYNTRSRLSVKWECY